MTQYTIRTLCSDDFDAIANLERDIFGEADEKLLCPYYIRLCCEFFSKSCFLALDGEKTIGYLLSFSKQQKNGSEVYCTTLAIRPEYQRTRAIIQILRAFLESFPSDIQECWFTVDEENKSARALHRMLGATEMGVRKDFYGSGDDRIMSRITRDQFEMLRPKYERLGLIPKSLHIPTPANNHSAETTPPGIAA